MLWPRVRHRRQTRDRRRGQPTQVRCLPGGHRRPGRTRGGTVARVRPSASPEVRRRHPDLH
eukprot:1252366-Alexandrium_andersonii.AAC.1